MRDALMLQAGFETGSSESLSANREHSSETIRFKSSSVPDNLISGFTLEP
jgi:hypothetical protein